LPYWDSTLDQNLPNSADSILFSEIFAGTTDSTGLVNTGPFVDFKTMQARKESACVS
jgi:hypothetical protein